ncbi:hypothetical protein SG34_032445 [Thalassomonas viridans]|uniref:Curlin n=1 Tax=Thalassomonas viridans TaxID=137584 RepID=A0AAE9Z8G5_9GAMM|nr:hypothetical protein [Thalassomonas viridans]WDE08631.1 hypothetical protein SG34_032445 [Thalassomonas viridans]
MKLNKTLSAGTVMMALGVTQAAFANENVILAQIGPTNFATIHQSEESAVNGATTIEVAQLSYGEGNLTDIRLDKSNQAAIVVEQKGDGNIALLQVGLVEQSDSNNIIVGQEGDQNKLEGMFEGGGNTLSLYQLDGSQDNTLILVGIGQGNTINLSQLEGSQVNMLTLMGFGSDNQVDILQGENENNVEVSLFGDSNNIAISQDGEQGNNLVNITIVGHDHNIDISQDGSGNQIRGMEEGATLLVEADSLVLDILQSGNDNIFEGENFNSSNVIDVTQDGINNYAAVTQGFTGTIGGVEVIEPAIPQ